MAQLVKNLPIMQETACRRPGSSFWARKNPSGEEWQQPLVFFPGESCGQKSLVGYSPRGRRKSDTTEDMHPRPQNPTW